MKSSITTLWECTIVPSKNTGKTITKIRINKKDVSICFGKERIKISQDAYAMAYLYVGKVLSKKEIKELEEISALAKLIKYSLSLLEKGHMTEWKMREKLYAKEAKKWEVDQIIERLKSTNLLDDDALIEDHIAWAEERCIGKNKVLKELANRGVFEERLNKIKFPYTKERQKAMCQLPRLEKKYAKYSFEKKKQHVYAGLLSLGFDSSVANEVIEKMAPINHRDENNKLKADFEKTYARLSKKYEGYELQTKVLAALRNKGYSYSSIKKMLEVKHNDDFRIC